MTYPSFPSKQKLFAHVGHERFLAPAEKPNYLCGSNNYFVLKSRHHNRVHRENRTTANSIATINSVATGEITPSLTAASSEAGDVFEPNNTQVCDLRYFRRTLNNE